MKRGFSAGNACASCSADAAGNDIVPPDVAARRPVDRVAAAAYDEDVLDRLLRTRSVAIGEGEIDGRLEGGDLALAVSAVRGDDEPRPRVVDPRAQAVGREAAEDDGEWIAPMRATASIAAIASGIMGR